VFSYCLHFNGRSVESEQICKITGILDGKCYGDFNEEKRVTGSADVNYGGVEDHLQRSKVGRFLVLSRNCK
jgi:hypothetical protein